MNRPLPAIGLALALPLTLALAFGTPAPAQDEGVLPPEYQTMVRLIDRIDELEAENQLLRRELAAVRLQADQQSRIATELQQFIDDRAEYGDDFTRYRAIKAAQEREAKQRLAAERRREREADREARRERRVQQTEQQRTEADRRQRYERAGFASIGLNVYTGRMGFSYPSRTTPGVNVEYEPYIGFYYGPGGTRTEIDYRTMTISGSVLNAAAETRNIGVAITFFDENGNQVGGDIVQVNNARPDVPYPFTSTLDMALNRAFDSWTAYVVYADPIVVAPK